MRNTVISAIAVAMLGFSSTAALAAGENLTGKWSAKIDLPLVPSSGALLPDGKVMLWSADGEFSFGSGGRVATTVFDPATNTNVFRAWQIDHNMFCTGTTQLADGRVLVNGGSQASRTSIFNPATQSWSSAANMTIARGYNSNTILDDGTVLTIGGSWNGGVANKPGEIWSSANTWTSRPGLTTAPMAAGMPSGFSNDSHMWLLPTGTGRVLYAGPSRNMQWLDTAGNGSVTSAGTRGDDANALNGIAVMYDAGLILKAGGGTEYSNVTSSSAAYLIDARINASVTKLSSMTYPRAYANSVVLPDGKVAIIGGQSFAQSFADSNSVLATEIWDPATRSFSVGAAMTVPRNYHSIAMLLPDGRVLAGGGGLCGGCSANHADVQIYSPGYLFDSAGNLKARPTITAAPSAVEPGTRVTVRTGADVAAFSMVRFSAATHTVNNDQRRLAITHRRVSAGTYELTIPSNTHYLLPGNWMLFAMDASGTPSVARIVTVAPNRIARLTSPIAVSGRVGTALSIPANHTALVGGVTYGASGLPAGLTVNATSGAITGTPGAAGNFTVALTATNGVQTVSVDFALSLAPAPNGAPTITAPDDQTVTVGSPVTLAVTASDPEGAALTYRANGLPPGLAISATSGRITGTPTTAGTYDAALTVTDPGNLSATATLRWTVQVRMPAVVRLDAPSIVEGATATYAPEVSNAAGASYRWNFGDGSPETDWAASPAASHSFATRGLYAVRLFLRAPDGRIAIHEFDQAVTAKPVDVKAGTQSSQIALDASGPTSRLYVVNPDNDSVGVVDASTGQLVAEVAVGDAPQSAALSPRGEVWVVNRDSASVSIIDRSNLRVTRTLLLPRNSRPYGVAFLGTDGSAIVTLEALGKVARFDAEGTFRGTTSVTGTPRGISMAPDGKTYLVTRFITKAQMGESTARIKFRPKSGGEVVMMTAPSRVYRRVFLAHSDVAETHASAPGLPNYLGTAAISPDGKTAWVPSKQDNIKTGKLRNGRDLNFQNTVRAIISRIDMTTGREDLASRIDLDNSGIASAVAYHPSGAWLFVALQTSREVAVVDPIGKREVFRFKVGRAPSSLAVSPDGLSLYVGNFMDRSLSLVDLSPMVNGGQKAVTVRGTVRTIRSEALAANVLAGKQFFYDAADTRLARDGYMSCAVCHDDGGTDGRTWDFTGVGEGLRNTTSLLGSGGTRNGFLHWTANFDEIQDFEGQIRAFAGGTGLMSDMAFNTGTRAQSLGDRKAGVSADLDALAAYVTSLGKAPDSPYVQPDGSFTALANSGREAFARQGCAACHATPDFTISAGPGNMRDVGTIKAKTSGQRMGEALTALDVPSLRGVWATAPYLHDGSAGNLKSAIKRHKAYKRIPNADLRAIEAYVMQLGGSNQ